jgi:hypothetical protein
MKHLMFSNMLPGSDSFTVIHCNGNVISVPLLSNGCLLWLYHSCFQLSCHNIILPPVSRSFWWSLFLWLSHQNPIINPLLPLLATLSAHLILIDLIILIILGVEDLL